ncbi:Enterobactin exporter EntS [Jannaschia aquimarina]|uniref:EntS protein n=2 Tax=Jannaschia aquimarina TaxID=935700 RepID=A0A0D1EGV1_9RHOB|nr:Enterobactin exporter EntS [Jannaschia aquimarina]SNT13316.1 Predicted arabinose efflux permease, MFS family [Jannaschia aquimarina]
MWAQRVTLGWLAWEVSGDPAFVGLIAALGVAPMWLTGPVFGALVDRADILKALRLTSGGMVLLLALAATLEGTVGLGRGGLVAMSLAMGVVVSAHHPVRMSLGPRLVPMAEVPSVIALSALNFNLARLLAPVLTGIALATVGAVATLWVAAALFAPMLFVTRWMNPRALPDEDPEPLRARLLTGARYIARTPLARRAILLTFLMAVLLRGYLELLPVMAEGIHGRGATGLGWLTASAGAGAVLAALGKAAGLRRRGLLGLMLVAGMGALLGQGLSGSWVATLAWTGLMGFASTFAGVSLQAMMQEDLPDGMRGRVMSLWVVVGMGAVAIGAGGMGWLAGQVGLPTTLIAAGVLGLSLLALLLPRWAGRTT